MKHEADRISRCIILYRRRHSLVHLPRRRQNFPAVGQLGRHVRQRIYLLESDIMTNLEFYALAALALLLGLAFLSLIYDEFIKP